MNSDSDTASTPVPKNKRVVTAVIFLGILIICYTAYYPNNNETVTMPHVRIFVSNITDPVAELLVLSKLIQQRLQYIQNPTDCKTARKVACNFDEACGYGCQVHHVVFCLIIAYATERTLVLAKGNGIYHGHSWDQVFLPLSGTCNNTDGESHADWPETVPVQVLHVPRINVMESQPDYIPMAIPAEFATQLHRIHPEPCAWWIAQFVKFAMRYQPNTQELIDRTARELKISSRPTVGVHVRRTDKYKEAKLRPLSEYMTEVQRYYKQRKVETRRIFLASDEPGVIRKAKRDYPQYEFVVNEKAVASAGMGLRYSEESLKGVIVDTHILSRMDYLVCTFSSNVCRLAYVMQMAVDPRTAQNYTSLDYGFIFGGSHIRRSVVEMPRYSFLGDQTVNKGFESF